jgi:two-component system, cell cycle sensor histidine kinase and response regulator CckA
MSPEFVEDHKGYIDVQNKQGRGTVFTLYFPAIPRELPEDKTGLSISSIMGNGESVLIVDDVREPGMDGLDTYRKILELHPGQKAIIASGFSETGRVSELQRLGAGVCLKKPFLLKRLGLAVKEELEK